MSAPAGRGLPALRPLASRAAAAFPGSPGSVGWRAIPRRVRLVAGLVLLAFVAMHLADLALGLDTAEAMDHARAWLLAPWQRAPGQALLLCAALAHAALGLQALAGRRTLRLSRGDWIQSLLGRLIPP